MTVVTFNLAQRWRTLPRAGSMTAILKRPGAILGASIMLYTCVFSYFTIVRMYALKASAWDLGNYNQAMHTTLFNHKAFYWTADLPSNPTGSLFGVYLSPFMGLLLPFYAIHPAPETLLVLQSLGIAVGAVPAYWIARDRLGSRGLGLLFGMTYLLSPALWGVNWFDFHPEAFIPAALLFIVHFYRSRQWLWLAIAALMALSIVEQVAIMMVPLSLYMLVEQRKSVRFWSFRPSPQTFATVCLVSGSFISLAISHEVIRWLSPESPLIFGKLWAWQELGASTTTDVPRAALAHPVRALHALAFDWDTKLGYVAGMLLPAALSVLSPAWLLLTVPWLGVSLTSNNPAYYSLGVQYPVFVAAFVFVGNVEGFLLVRRLAGDRWRPRHQRATIALMIAGAASAIVMSNPFYSFGLATMPWSSYGTVSVTQKGHAAREMTKLIEPDASVLAQQDIFPLVSGRLNAYTPPMSAFMPPGSSFFEKLHDLVDKSDYVLLDRDYDWASSQLILSEVGDRYGVVGQSNGILLLKRGYTDKPVIYEPYKKTFSYKELNVVNGSINRDAAATSDQVIARRGGEPAASDVWWGPYAYLPAGRYRVTAWLRGDLAPSDEITVDAAAFVKSNKLYVEPLGSIADGYLPNFSMSAEEPTKVIFPGVTVHGGDLSAERYRPFTFEFNSDVEYSSFEFRGMNATTTGPLSLDRIDVEQIGIVPRPAMYVQFGEYPAFLYDARHTPKLFEIARLIPKNARLAASASTLPLLDGQGQASPIPPMRLTTRHILAAVGSTIDTSDYILLDERSDAAAVSLVLGQAEVARDFRLYAYADGVVLLKRGYQGSPVQAEGAEYDFDGRSMTTPEGVRRSTDSTAHSEVTLRHAWITGDDFWWGPYAFLAPGDYDATVRLKAAAPIVGEALRLQQSYWPVPLIAGVVRDATDGFAPAVSAGTPQDIDKTVLSSRTIDGGELAPGEFHDFTLHFHIDRYAMYELAGLQVVTSVPLDFGGLRIIMTRPGLRNDGDVVQQ